MDITQIRNKFQNHVPTLQNVRGQYAVLVPLIETPEGISLLYEVRSPRLRHHSGEVCFPGGRIEHGENPVQCALRETFEELSIPAADIEILGQLDFLYLRSEGLMYPILAHLNSTALTHIRNNPSEVQSTFTVPVSWLQEHPPRIFRYRMLPEIGEDFPYSDVGVAPNYPWSYGHMEVPVYKGLRYPLWGLTARITYWLMEKMNEFTER